MTLAEYIISAVKTEAPVDGTWRRWQALHDGYMTEDPEDYPPHPVRLLHAAIGFASEVFELEFEATTQEDFLEEIGDVCWYGALALDALGYTAGTQHDALLHDHMLRRYVQDIPQMSSPYSLRMLRYYTGMFAGMAKAYAFYDRIEYRDGTEPAVNAFHLMAVCVLRMLQYLQATLAGWHKVSFNDILDANIEKLQKKRYKQGFTEEAANERADKK